MIHFLVGPSGAFTNWCAEIMLAAMRQLDEGTEVVHVDACRELTTGLLQRQSRSTLVILKQAPASLYSAMRVSGRRFVVACDDPTRCLFELVQQNGGDLIAAIRTIASGVANLPSYMSLPNALVLKTPVEVSDLAKIANHLGLILPQERTITAPPELSHDANCWWRSLSDEVRATITGAFGPILDSAAIPDFNWASCFFWQDADRSKFVDGPIDITGRARCLFEGPAIAMPLGRWQLSLRLYFSEMAAGNVFRIELFSGITLGARDIVVQGAGTVETDFDFTVDGVATGPLIFRVLLLRAAFDGTITFVGARVVTLSDDI